MAKVACYDCGLEYGKSSWIEAIIPDKIWDYIRPDGCGQGCGILCISCISRRLNEKKLSNVPVWLCGTEPLTAKTDGPDIIVLRTLTVESCKK